MPELTRKQSHAKQLIEDELLLEAFLGVREKMVRAIETAPLGSEVRADMQMGLQMLRQVRRELESCLSAAKLEEFYSREQ